MRKTRAACRPARACAWKGEFCGENVSVRGRELSETSLPLGSPVAAHAHRAILALTEYRFRFHTRLGRLHSRREARIVILCTPMYFPIAGSSELRPED